MKKSFTAEVFVPIDSVPAAIAAVAAADCKLTINHSLIDPDGERAFGRVVGLTDLPEIVLGVCYPDLGDFVAGLVRPLGGESRSGAATDPAQDCRRHASGPPRDPFTTRRST